ncbi:MAG: site-specific integrase [Deltaproteobacteria bacterium]|nr:site-specific integrase [Deltaproteobacteria bacterium]
MLTLRCEIYRIRSKAGSWRWGVDWDEPSGRRRKKIIGTKVEAQAARDKLRIELTGGTYSPDLYAKRGFTVGQLRDRWLEHRTTKLTIETDRVLWRRLAEFLGEDREARTLTTRDMDDLREKLKESKSYKGTPLSVRSVNYHLKVLRAGLRLAHREGRIANVPTFTFLKGEIQRSRIGTGDEIDELFDCCDYQALRIALALACETGMRRGEICALSWEEIDFVQRTITFKGGKGGKWRTVLFGELSTRELASVEAPQTGKIFSIKANTITSSYRRLCQQLGIEDLHFHDLRHTYATRLRRAGVDLVTIKTLLGHEDWSTMERYQTVDLTDLRAAHERLKTV